MCKLVPGLKILVYVLFFLCRQQIWTGTQNFCVVRDLTPKTTEILLGDCVFNSLNPLQEIISVQVDIYLLFIYFYFIKKIKQTNVNGFNIE